MSSPDPISPAGGGFRLVAGATAIAGILAYTIQAVVARGLGDSYAVFAVFWSALFLVIGALAGVQQEVARATRHRSGAVLAGRANVVAFAGGVASAVVVALLLSGLAWGSAVFGSPGFALVAPLALGAGLSVLLASVTGTMYGLRTWRPLAVAIVLDVALRLLFVAVGLALGFNVVGIAWATVLPIGLVVMVILGITRGSVLHAGELDVSYRGALVNVLRTIVASGATALLVSGFPLLLGVTSPTIATSTLSAVIFALTLTRAPLVISTIAMQSYLVVHFRDAGRSIVRSLLSIMGVVGAVGVLGALLAWWIGSDLIVWIAGDVFRVDPGFVGLLVASSIPTAWLALSGTAVLARGEHNYYSAGWLVAAIVAMALLLLPFGIEARTLISLSFAPLAGLVVHYLAVIRATRGVATEE
ncbi:MAG: hypothetical protein ACOH10_05085 [Rhodoglobus sp.]